jgi:hypothetical protein
MKTHRAGERPTSFEWFRRFQKFERFSEGSSGSPFARRYEPLEPLLNRR